MGIICECIETHYGPQSAASSHKHQWLPSDLADLVIWLATFDMNGNEDRNDGWANGDLVSLWVDKSGNGNSPVQATVGNRPIFYTNILNSLPALYFDGSTNVQTALAVALSQPITMFLVAQLATAQIGVAARNTILDSDDNAARLLVRKNLTAPPYQWGIYMGTSLNGDASDDEWNIWTVVANGAASSFSLNAISQASGNAGAQNADGLTIGTTYDGLSGWVGYLAELIVYDALLTATEQTQVETYLATQYNLFLETTYTKNAGNPVLS